MLDWYSPSGIIVLRFWFVHFWLHNLLFMLIAVFFEGKLNYLLMIYKKQRKSVICIASSHSRYSSPYYFTCWLSCWFGKYGWIFQMALMVGLCLLINLDNCTLIQINALLLLGTGCYLYCCFIYYFNYINLLQRNYFYNVSPYIIRLVTNTSTFCKFCLELEFT